MSLELQSVGSHGSPASDDESSRVVFFDGVCGLCHSSVDFILVRDTQRAFRFAPLQGTTAQRVLPKEDIQNLDTLVLQTASGTYRRSSAVVRILWGLPRLWPLCGWLLWLVPRPVRDWGYRMVSANRLRWFGKKETCRLPTPEERDRFLD